MLQKLSHYFSALTVLLVCAGIYHTTMTRWLTPVAVPAIKPKPPAELPDLNHNLSDLFPPGSWQLGECNKLMTENGILLFETQEQAAKDRWKVSPITLVIGRGLDAAKGADPVVLTAQDGADIQFAEELEMIGSGGTPLIKRGQMSGKVTIERKSSRSDAESLYVETSDVVITNQQVSTTEVLSMKIGNATLIGQDMTIKLAATATRAASTASETSVLDEMELVYLKHLEIPLSDFTNRSNSPGESGKPDPGTVFISCDGGLRYDFMSDQLSVREHIEVVRRAADQVEDRFTSDRLDLALRDPTNSKAPRDGPIDWIDRFRAIGNPAVISLPSQDFELLAEKIEFDSVRGLLSAQGTTGVQLRRGPINARITQFVYQYDPEEPRTLGVIEAQGAGIVTVDDPEIAINQVRWRQSFLLQPLARTTLDQLDQKTLTSKVRVLLEGEILANLTDGGTCKANEMEGILKPISELVEIKTRAPVEDVPVATTNLAPIGTRLQNSVVAQPATPPTISVKKKVKQRFVPESFEIKGDVLIDSKAILANANSVFLEFVDQVDPEPISTGAPAETENANSALRQWVGPPDLDGESDPVAPPRPIVRGDMVSAQLRLSKDGVVAQDMSASGGIELEHSIEAGDQVLKAKMRGEEMRMIRHGGKDFLHLAGGVSKARLDLGDGYFVGPAISVWPTENVVQIQGAGEFLVPSKVMPQSFGDNGSEIQWVETPLCRWNGTMHFDGKTATLTDGVHIQASIVEGESNWAFHIDGDRLEMDLDTKVDVQQTQSMRNASLSEMRVLRSAERPVVIRAEQTDLQQSVVSRHQLIAANLTLSPGADGGLGAGGGLESGASGASGIVTGQGPGWYRGWMLSDGTSSLAKRLSLPTNPDEDSDPKAPVLNGVHLAFHDAMQADLGTKMLSFLGGVRAGMRELKTWEEVVDVRQMERLAVGESTLDCRDLRFGISPEMNRNMPKIRGMPVHWEMESVGGVVLRTRDEKGWLQCTAGRAAYASRKGRLIVEKSADRSANVTQTNPDGSPGFNFNVSYASVNPKTFDVSTKLEGATIGNLPTKKPR